MLVTVIWHNMTNDGAPIRKARLVEVREREEGFYEEGMLRQAMRQYGYSEDEINQRITSCDPVSFLPREKPPKTCILCETCGSSDIRRDAWAAYNEDTGQWELDATYDDAFCIDCDAACDLIEEEISG